jgi:hypothetical protein
MKVVLAQQDVSNAIAEYVERHTGLKGPFTLTYTIDPALSQDRRIEVAVEARK